MKRYVSGFPAYTFSVIVVAAVLLLTCLPVPEMAQQVPIFPGADKIVHAIMFFGVVSALVFDVERKNPEALTRGRKVAFLAAGIALGGGTELVQAFADINRSGDINDFIADVLGAYAGYLVAPALCRRMLR